MGRTVCTEPQCLYKGDLYLYLTIILRILRGQPHLKVTSGDGLEPSSVRFCFGCLGGACGRENAGLFKMTVGVLTTCHTQYTSDGSICIFDMYVS